MEIRLHLWNMRVPGRFEALTVVNMFPARVSLCQFSSFILGLYSALSVHLTSQILQYLYFLHPIIIKLPLKRTVIGACQMPKPFT